MRHAFLKRGHRRLLVLALGWGQECSRWTAREFGKRDALILSHWDDPAPLPDLSGYEGYDLIAWSFGVWSAAQVEWPVRFDQAIAVNGTLFPADDGRGIPVEIFRRTISAWKPEISARKFWRRMGAASLPDRKDESLLTELQYFERCFSDPSSFRSTVRYTRAVVGEEDRIFPPENQKRAWAGLPLLEKKFPHDITDHFQELLSLLPPIREIDKSAIAQRFGRSRGTYEEHAVVQKEMAEKLFTLLPVRRFGRALEFGCGTGNLTRMLKPHCDRLFRNDLFPDDTPDYLEGDIETLSFPRHLQLVASNAVWQWLNHPAEMIRKIHEALDTQGIVAISTFAPGTCGELSELLDVSLDYQTPDQFRQDLERYFDLLAFEEESRVLTFQEPYEVLKHLKYTGVTGVSSGFHWGRKKLEAFAQAYRERFPNISLTYRPVFVIGKKKEETER